LYVFLILKELYRYRFHQTVCLCFHIQNIYQYSIFETLKGNNITQEGIYVHIILSQIILKSMISILSIALIYISRLYCAFSNKKYWILINIHRLAWGSFACGTTGQLSIVPIHKTALRTVTLILIIFISTF
jgi:hypothetical protein